MKTLIPILIIFIALLSFTCTTQGSSEGQAAASEPAVDPAVTEAVLNHHLEAFGNNDLEALIEDYSEASVIITPDNTIKGLAEIREFFEGLLPAFPTEGTEFTMDKMEIHGEIAYIVWHATTPSVEVSLGTDTFVIVDGKILTQTFAGVINPVEEITE